MLRHPEWREALLGALGGIDRLVLLGDLVELRHGPIGEALNAARPVLEQIAARLPAGAEVVILGGNHDHHLLSGWFERRAQSEAPPPLGLQSPVDWEPHEVLAVVARCLAPATVTAAYPGIWLREDVYATHGHYSDRHTTVPLFERLFAGAMALLVAEPPGGPHSAEDYEKTLAPMYAWIHSVAQTGGSRVGRGSHGVSTEVWGALTAASSRREVRSRAIRLAFPVAVAGVNLAKLGPVRPDISGPALRRAGLRAMREVLARLEITAPHVLFGHTHRAGPLPRDDPREWRARTGSVLLNTGCWVHEPAFLGSDPSVSPYRAGFAALIEDEGPPRLVNLLDGVRVPVPA